jgi:hypothetical protein
MKQGHYWISAEPDFWVHFRDDGSISELYVSKAGSKKQKPEKQAVANPTNVLERFG